jgi:hypothetical protein
MSGHNGLRGFFPGETSERSFTLEQFQRLGKLHGMAGIGTAGINAPQFIAMYNKVVQSMGPGAVAGFGTDTNGLAMGMPPVKCTLTPKSSPCVANCLKTYKDDAKLSACLSKCKAQYNPPDCSNVGSPVVYNDSFPASTLGSHTWDYNNDGVAHYGMLADFLKHVRSYQGGADLVDNNLMTGAQYFYDTWKRAESLAVVTCGPGFTLSANRQCVCQPPNVATACGTCLAPCPTGFTMGQGCECACRAPNGIDSSGACKFCKEPNIVDSTGHCVPPPQPTCKENQVVIDGKCAPKGAQQN